MTRHVDYASEVYSTKGPTGKFREVIEATVLDYGGNVLAGPGPVGKLAKRTFRVPVRLVPEILGGFCDSADALTGPHVEG